MGCVGSSQTQPGGADGPSDWVEVTLQTNTGDLVDNTGGMLAKCSLQREPEQLKDKKFHFVEQNIGGTWEETKLGGKVKYTVEDSSKLDAIFKEAGGKTWMSEGSATSTNSLDGPKKVARKYTVAGIAEWSAKGDFGDSGLKTFLVTGAINETVHIVDKENGEVLFTLHQSSVGQELKMYDCLISKKAFRASVSDEERALTDSAFCGMRPIDVSYDESIGGGMKLKLSPLVLEKLPVSVIAIAIMYSSHSLNDMDM